MVFTYAPDFAVRTELIVCAFPAAATNVRAHRRSERSEMSWEIQRVSQEMGHHPLRQKQTCLDGLSCVTRPRMNSP